MDCEAENTTKEALIEALGFLEKVTPELKQGIKEGKVLVRKLADEGELREFTVNSIVDTGVLFSTSLVSKSLPVPGHLIMSSGELKFTLMGSEPLPLRAVNR